MIKVWHTSHFYLYTLLGVAVGLCIPFAFILLDLKQLGLPLNPLNVYEIFNSQNIYFFSTILFPVLFGMIFGLYFNTYSQNQKLAHQEKYIKSILDSLNDCILVCDAAGKIKYANSNFYNMYKGHIHSIENLLGIKEIRSVVTGQSFELCLLNKHDRRQTINYSVYKLQEKYKASYKHDSFIVSIRDIEELKKNEQIIETQTAQLFEASKLSALGEMASGFAHEINNPLAIISGNLTFIGREISKDLSNKEAIIKNLDICKKMVKRMSRIIVGLQNLSHSEQGEMKVVIIKDLVEDAVIMANLKIIGKGIDFKVDIEAVKNETIFCNAVQISQVLLNLLGNAVDAIEGQEKPWLRLKVEAIDSSFKFIIQDSGHGIPLELQKKIFEPMFTTKPVGKGTGLGLSISRAIIEKHSGSMIINNSCSNTCFEFTLKKELSAKVAA